MLRDYSWLCLGVICSSARGGAAYSYLGTEDPIQGLLYTPNFTPILFPAPCFCLINDSTFLLQLCPACSILVPPLCFLAGGYGSVLTHNSLLFPASPGPFSPAPTMSFSPAFSHSTWWPCMAQSCSVSICTSFCHRLSHTLYCTPKSLNNVLSALDSLYWAHPFNAAPEGHKGKLSFVCVSTRKENNKL